MIPLRNIAPILLAAALLVSCLPSGNGDVGVGKPLPAFELPALDGGEVSSASYLGKPVVLNFWATWCGPCIKEIPTLKALHRDASATVVTVAIDTQGAEIVQPFVDKHGIDYPVLIADPAFLHRYNGNGIPYTLILDATHKIVKMHRGYVSLRSLERDLRRAES